MKNFNSGSGVEVRKAEADESFAAYVEDLKAIDEDYESYQRLGRKRLEKALDIGEKLKALKKRAKKDWKKLVAKMKFGDRMTRMYLQIADNRKSLEGKDLNIGEALKFLREQSQNRKYVSENAKVGTNGEPKPAATPAVADQNNSTPKTNPQLLEIIRAYQSKLNEAYRVRDNNKIADALTWVGDEIRKLDLKKFA